MTTEVQILYWRDIPAQVKARDGRQRAARPLSERFQQAIDAAAMRAGKTSTDGYLEGWRASAWQAREGTPEVAARSLTEDLERAYPQERLLALARAEGRLRRAACDT
jgi:hypothetical protein